MNIHWLQHVPFEGLGLIEQWAEKNGHTLSITRCYAGDPFPTMDDFQLLIVMGGPMGVNDTDSYPWLIPEKNFLGEALKEQKAVLGICLGAQLLAQVLGAEVMANEEKEIGWFPVGLESDVPAGLISALPQDPVVFHWHGDTFSLPQGAHRLYSSEACKNQAFIIGDRVIGLQFHLETTTESVALLVEHCGHELVPAKWIQSEAELKAADNNFYQENYSILKAILEYLISPIQ